MTEFNPNTYISPINIWSSIDAFVSKNIHQYIDELSEMELEPNTLKIIKTNAKRIFDSKTYDSFRKCIDGVYNKKHATFSRKNALLLCFALNLNDIDSFNNILQNHLHENELSAKSIDEFIIICGLKLGIGYSKINELLIKYKEIIDDAPTASLKLIEHQTDYIYDEVINSRINTLEDLINFFEQPSNLAFFAKTRNSHYFALFNDIEWDTFVRLHRGLPADDIQDIINYHLEKYTNAYIDDKNAKETIKSYYLGLFSIVSWDEDIYNKPIKNALTESDILALTKIYPGIFLDVDTYSKLIKRIRPIDISSGTYLIKILEEINPNDDMDDPDYFLDFTDYNDFLGQINEFLSEAGFPVLNEYNNFDKLILDTMQDTLNENAGLTSLDMKNAFFQLLRERLKAIANCVY